MTKDDFKFLRVLVADDDAFSQKIVVTVLNNLGVKNIILAENGAEALESLARAVEPIDLVISDIEMPEMGGFELARRIRLGAVAKFKDIPILMLTGHSTEDNIRKGRIHRIQGFIVKPPSAEILERNMTRALKKK
ncbi:MAG: response regulator [Pseudomonadota bacterium]